MKNNDDVYKFISNENFEQIKQILEWGIDQQQNPATIAAHIAEDTKMPIVQARVLVSNELLGAMEHMKDKMKLGD